MAHTTSTASRRQATIVIIGCAVLFVGIAMAVFTPCVYLQRMHRKHVDSSQLGREMLGIVLGFLCYVVPFFLAMGALASADSTGARGIVDRNHAGDTID